MYEFKLLAFVELPKPNTSVDEIFNDDSLGKLDDEVSSRGANLPNGSRKEHFSV